MCTTKCISTRTRKFLGVFFASAELDEKQQRSVFLTFARHLVTRVTQGPSHPACDDSWVEIQTRRTIRAENEVEANKLVNNYRVRSLKVNYYIH